MAAPYLKRDSDFNHPNSWSGRVCLSLAMSVRHFFLESRAQLSRFQNPALHSRKKTPVWTSGNECSDQISRPGAAMDLSREPSFFMAFPTLRRTRIGEILDMAEANALFFLFVTFLRISPSRCTRALADGRATAGTTQHTHITGVLCVFM